MNPPSDSSVQPVAKLARVNHSPDISKENADAPITPGVLEPSKGRYVGRYSSIAFPLYVGMEVHATKPPRLHSFAYHTGIRKEPPCAVQPEIAERISWNSTRSLIDAYASIIHPVFGFLDMDAFYTKCERHWHGQLQDMVFEAIASGVIALASLFNGGLEEDMEMWLVLHAKKVLEDCTISRFPSAEQIAAWILRTLYIRCTGRPHVTWISSCSIMHLVEATGLHRTPESVLQTTGNTLNQLTSSIANKTAQVAHCLHILIAFEYGRSIMATNHQVLEHTDEECRRMDFTPQLCNLITTLPLSQHAGETVALTQELLSSLERISEITLEHDFLVLVKTDLVLGIYRRLRVLDSKIQPDHNEKVIAAGRHALAAARRLVSQNKPWWNVVGSIFQFACTLLAIDTPTSCEILGETMDTLELIVDHLDTHLAKEALSTARQLVRASLNKKKKGVEALERIVGTEAPEIADSQMTDQLAQDIAAMSPSLAAQLPFDLETLWAMEFSLHYD
ncbi:hypothetical protein N7532_011850 [Penicillium argentinense]|uniref:Xylanolytic transcriptional activator regulatory domain-containing protein n=1 Tax=Penicillium argentinense TaxID=1131581 RepID=A0A9W9EJ90_9EURO|nr:uncharacterized protein N7532_011850 [Penicillium argentinense]KAJ5082807.1 hypothetical protein N7532_011850 [Penicillium argentinense]